MNISKIRVENFRNLKTADFAFSPGLVVLVGKNGAGKTNFLESLYFGCFLGRFPESKLSQLFQKEKQYFRIGVKALDEDKETSLDVFYQTNYRSYKSLLKEGGQKVSKDRFRGKIPIVSFLPQDLVLLSGSPSRRRSYIDECLESVSAEYRFHLKEYKKTLQQRNSLLEMVRERQASEQELDVWDEKISEHGSFVTKKRKLFFDLVGSLLTNTLHNISPELKDSTASYIQSASTEQSEYLKKLNIVKDREIGLGTSILGPHRDDFEIKLSESSVVGMVSRGQLRAIILALKMIEKEYVEKESRLGPVVLVDDVTSEFDDQHQKSLIDFLSGFEQVFMTTAHFHEIKNSLPGTGQVFQVNQGEIIKSV